MEISGYDPKITQLISGVIKNYDAAWVKRLQVLVYKVLSQFIDKTKINSFIDNTAMPVWMLAFTHETFDPEYNNEDIEFLGDSMLQSVFPKYLMVRYPYFHKKEYTYFNTHYMSGEEHVKYSRKLGLDQNYIRMGGLDKSNRNANADVFEAFVGALSIVAEKNAPGTGYSYCYNFIVNFFKDFTFDENIGLGDPKTQLIQLFSRFGGLYANYDAALVLSDRKLDFGDIEYIVTFNDSQTNLLQNLGKQVTIAAFTGRGSTKKVAEKSAYEQAYKYLESIGVTSKWAKEQRKNIIFAYPQFTPYITAMNVRFSTENYESIDFSKPAKTTGINGAVISLIGTTKHGKDVRLGTITSNDASNGYLNAKVSLVKAYAENTQTPFDLR